jgi:hypothetical protein
MALARLGLVVAFLACAAPPVSAQKYHTIWISELDDVPSKVDDTTPKAAEIYRWVKDPKQCGSDGNTVCPSKEEAEKVAKARHEPGRMKVDCGIKPGKDMYCVCEMGVSPTPITAPPTVLGFDGGGFTTAPPVVYGMPGGLPVSVLGGPTTLVPCQPLHPVLSCGSASPLVTCVSGCGAGGTRVTRPGGLFARLRCR